MDRQRGAFFNFRFLTAGLAPRVPASYVTRQQNSRVFGMPPGTGYALRYQPIRCDIRTLASLNPPHIRLRSSNNGMCRSAVFQRGSKS